MSATMSGLDSLCAWLGARLFLTNFRPVALTEFAVFKGTVYLRRPGSVTGVCRPRAACRSALASAAGLLPGWPTMRSESIRLL
jgi:hypothetical protein